MKSENAEGESKEGHCDGFMISAHNTMELQGELDMGWIKVPMNFDGVWTSVGDKQSASRW